MIPYFEFPSIHLGPLTIEVFGIFAAAGVLAGAEIAVRAVRGWRGEKGACLLIAGFAVVMFTYLGMHLLPTAEESAHVYSE